MYLLSQMAIYLLLAFSMGFGVGYALWRLWGERECVAKFNAAEMRLAAHVARMEQAAAHHRVPHNPQSDQAQRDLRELEIRHAALLKEAESAAIRKAEAAAEKKLSDLAARLGYDFTALTTAGRAAVHTQDAMRRSAEIAPLFDPPREVRKGE